MTRPVPCSCPDPGLSLVCSVTDHLLLNPGPGRDLLSWETLRGTEKGRAADHTWTGGQAVCQRQAQDKRSMGGGGPSQLGAPGVGAVRSQHPGPTRAPTPTRQPADTPRHHPHRLPEALFGFHAEPTCQWWQQGQFRALVVLT